MLTTRILAGLGGVFAIGTLACADVTGGPPERVLTSLRISPSSFWVAPIPVLNLARVVIHATDQHGEPLVLERGSFSISISDPSVVTVSDVLALAADPDGSYYEYIQAYVTALAAGEAVITASWTVRGVTRTATAKVKVESMEGWSVKLTPGVLTVAVGSTERFAAAVLDETGTTRTSDADVFVFASDHGDLVALHEDEWCFAWPCEAHINVRGVATGEATVTARVGGLSATATVIVVP